VVARSPAGIRHADAAVGAGSASIVFTSGSEPTLARTIAATIAPQFVQPTQTYPLAGASSPAAGSRARSISTPPEAGFDKPPTLGAGGSIRIFRKSDDALVDVIRTERRNRCDRLSRPGAGPQGQHHAHLASAAIP
jgi:pectate lyase